MPDMADENQGLIVTPEMVEAGMDEVRQCRLTDDLPALVERVYLAMHYASCSASRTISSR